MAFTLDYDLWIILDAEDLAETGIGEAYEGFYYLNCGSTSRNPRMWRR